MTNSEQTSVTFNYKMMTESNCLEKMVYNDDAPKFQKAPNRQQKKISTASTNKN